MAGLLDWLTKSSERGYDTPPAAPARLPTAEAFFPASPERGRAAADAFGRGDVAGGVGQAVGAVGEAIGRGIVSPFQAAINAGGRFVQGLTGAAAAPNQIPDLPTSTDLKALMIRPIAQAPAELLARSERAPAQAPARPSYPISESPYDAWEPSLPLRTVRVTSASGVKDYQVPVQGEQDKPPQWPEIMPRLMPDGREVLYAMNPDKPGSYRRIYSPAEIAAGRAAELETLVKQAAIMKDTGQGERYRAQASSDRLGVDLGNLAERIARQRYEKSPKTLTDLERYYLDLAGLFSSAKPSDLREIMSVPRK